MKARAEASERLSAEIVMSMTSGLLVVSEHREVRTLNPAGRRLLGLGERRDPGSCATFCAMRRLFPGLSKSAPPTGRAIVRRAVALSAGAPGATHIGVTASPVRSETGQSHGVMCLFTDLTEIVDLEEQLRLKDSLARLGELTAGIAHEFRNGLATIHGYSRLLDPDAPAGRIQALRAGHPRRSRRARRGRHEFPELRQADRTGARARRHARDRRARG